MNAEPMPYDRDVSGLKIAPSLYTFPGDETIDAGSYEDAMRNTYLRKVPLAISLREQFGIPYSDEDSERIKRVMVGMGWLDHLLDEAPDRKEALKVYRSFIRSLSDVVPLSNVPQWVRPELHDVGALMRNALISLPQECSKSIVEKALRIGDISQEKTAKYLVKDYASILVEEGMLSSDVVIECLGKDARAARGYEQLHYWNRRAIAAATLLDAAIDLKRDCDDSLTSVRPTLWNRVYLFGRACSYIPLIAKGLGIGGIRTLVRVGVN